MAAKIMESGDTESSVFAPRGSFMVTVRAVTGTIDGDWFLYYSDDATRAAADWQKAHDDPFSETYYNDVFDTGIGFYYQLPRRDWHKYRGYISRILPILPRANTAMINQLLSRGA